MMRKKFNKYILSKLPVTRKRHAETIMQLMKVVGGLIESEKQHSTLEYGIVQDIQSLKAQLASLQKERESGKSGVEFA
jgi:hypothetical protein